MTSLAGGTATAGAGGAAGPVPSSSNGNGVEPAGSRSAKPPPAARTPSQG
ncbi:hypothetical protein [Streptomyces sp. TE33382]